MKTVVVANFPNPKHVGVFMEYFPNIAELKDVVFIKNPETIEYLKEELTNHAGKFDRVLINTHGPREDAPKMNPAGDSYIEIPDIVKLINQASLNITVRIDLSSCFIGSHFEQIEKCDPESKYYQNLRAELKPDQLLNLHGDDRPGSIGLSFGSRLYGIVKSINYSTSEAIFDSSEALFSVRKNKDGQLESNSCPIFTKDNNSSISSENHLRYLKLASEEADKFDSKARTQNITIGHQKYAQISQNSSLLKVDFEDRLYRAFHKELDESDKKGVEFIQRLCLDKIDLNFKNKDGDAALMIAASKNRLETLQLLIDNKANLNLQNKNGWSPLMVAASENRLETLQLLIDNKANSNLQNKDGWSPLMIATSKNHLETIRLLIAKGANSNLQNNNGDTALRIAVSENRLEALQLLIDNKADLNLQNKDGWSPLMIAASENNEQTTRSLINAGADVDLKNNYGATTLMIVILRDHQKVIQILIDAKANLNLQNNIGDTALMMAASENHLETLRLLIAKGANLNLQDKNGDTALMMAVKNGNKEAIVMLIEGGAENYSDAQELASKIGQKDVIETLNQAIIKRAKKEEELRTPIPTPSLNSNSRGGENQIQPSSKEEESEAPTPAPRSAPLLNSNPRGSEEAELSVTEQELRNPNSYRHHYQQHHPKIIQNPQLRGGNPQPLSTITTNIGAIGVASFIGSLGIKFIVNKLNRANETHKKK